MAIQKDKKGKPISRDFEDFLSELLQDPQEARDYLNAALEDEDYRVFLLALKDVAKAFGISRVSSDSNLNRENIYRMLSENGNPQTSSLIALLRAVGIRLKTEAIEKDSYTEHHEENLEVAANVFSIADRKYAKSQISAGFFQPTNSYFPHCSDNSQLALAS